MAPTWFTRLRSQFFGINLLVAILATLAGILVVTRQAQSLARELLASHMAEVGYSLSTSLSDAPDQAGMQQRLEFFLRTRRLSTSVVVVTGPDGRIVAASDSSYVGQPWAQIFPGSQPPVPNHACQSSSWQGCQEGQFELPLASGQALDAARSLAPLAGSNLPALVLHYIAPQNAYDLAVSGSVLIGLGVMVALLILLSLLELALFNGQVFRPLEELARANQALAEGRTSEGHLLPAPGTAREIAGLIESRWGKGNFVRPIAGRGREEARRAALEKAAREFIGGNPLGQAPVSAVLHALQQRNRIIKELFGDAVPNTAMDEFDRYFGRQRSAPGT
jgi:HAMP domain-containing protein